MVNVNSGDRVGRCVCARVSTLVWLLKYYVLWKFWCSHTELYVDEKQMMKSIKYRCINYECQRDIEVDRWTHVLQQAVTSLSDSALTQNILTCLRPTLNIRLSFSCSWPVLENHHRAQTENNPLKYPNSICITFIQFAVLCKCGSECVTSTFPGCLIKLNGKFL